MVLEICMTVAWILYKTFLDPVMWSSSLDSKLSLSGPCHVVLQPGFCIKLF